MNITRKMVPITGRAPFLLSMNFKSYSKTVFSFMHCQQKPFLLQQKNFKTREYVLKKFENIKVLI